MRYEQRTVPGGMGYPGRTGSSEGCGRVTDGIYESVESSFVFDKSAGIAYNTLNKAAGK